MMINYETLLIFLIILTIIPLVAGFYFKNKTARYFSWLMSIPFLSITISTINKHSEDINKQTQKFIGLYRIDTIKSMYKAEDLSKYQNLEMVVNPDQSFVINDTSIFLFQKGSWEFHDTEDGGYVSSIFPSILDNASVYVGNNLWGFSYRCLKKGDVNDVIYFRKVKDNL